jgi:methanethiol S-methyltransferase
VHSFLAGATVKSYIKKTSPVIFRYYRLLYILFAALSFAGILYFQCSLVSPLIAVQPQMQYIASLFLVCPGLLVMMIAIRKYFRLLSGIRTLYEPKPAPQLLCSGIHRYVRHPLYAGTLLFIWGLFFIFPLLNNLVAVNVITAYVFIGIRLEERKLLLEFGSDYADYMAQVPMLVPGPRSFANKKGQPSGRPFN